MGLFGSLLTEIETISVHLSDIRGQLGESLAIVLILAVPSHLKGHLYNLSSG